jgi:hypothetical protein
MTAIADAIAQQRGTVFTNTANRENYREHLRKSMCRLRNKCVIEMLGEGSRAVWRMVDRQDARNEKAPSYRHLFCALCRGLLSGDREPSAHVWKTLGPSR